MKGKLKLLSGKRIESPLSKKTRPTSSKVREALINILGNKLKGASWLDLCSGSGAMACEVLQKGVKRVLALGFAAPVSNKYLFLYDLKWL